ncbi:MAG: glycine zipper 2TM domain-containing protein [Solirubrobacterales bacterium]
MRTMTSIIAVAALIGGLAVEIASPRPALADPPPWAGVWKKHHHHGHDDDDDDYRVLYVPVPTAVERPVYHRSVPVARGLPYGFNRGTCDRGLISSEMGGNLIGGVAGGLVGSRFGRGSGRTAATIGGTIIGVLVGGSVGRSMDAVDQGCVAGALDYVPDRRPIAWAGDSGESYRVMPVNSFERQGQYCREYQATAVIGGRRQQTYGTACRQPDGQWEIVE